MPSVTSLERQHSLIEPARQRLAELGLSERVTIREADGSLGDARGAPWDGIIVTAAAPAVPMALREQLADGARLVIPVGPRDHQYMTVVERHGTEWTEWTDGACVFVPLIGRADTRLRRTAARTACSAAPTGGTTRADPRVPKVRPADRGRLAGTAPGVGILGRP